MSAKKQKLSVVHLRTLDERQAAVYSAAVTIVKARGRLVTGFVGGLCQCDSRVAKVADFTIRRVHVKDRERDARVIITIFWHSAKLFRAEKCCSIKKSWINADAQVETFVEGDWVRQIVALAESIRIAASVTPDISRWESEGGQAADAP